MTDKDICGAETSSTDHPCQNPAGSCPIPSHTDESSNRGRPSKFTEDRKEALLNAARKGTTVEGCARAAGIHHSTLYDWLDKHTEFSEAFKRARAEGEQKLIQDVAVDDPKFILERSFDYVKTEKREITGEDGGPITVSSDVVTVTESNGE